MALESQIDQADTASPVRRAALAGEIRRRKRNNRMGAGGSDLRPPAGMPATMAALELDLDHVTKTFRYVDRTAPDLDDRVELLHIILGE